MRPATGELSALGDTLRLTAEVRDQSGNVMEGATVTWASSADSVAPVDAAGQVTAVGNGTATITARAGEILGTAVVSVVKLADRVAVSPAESTFAALGDTLQLAAEGFDPGGHTVSGAEFSWGSSDETVATVDATGLVTAVGNGTATVTAGSGAAVGTATVTVTQTIAAVALEPAGPILTQAGTKGTDTIVAAALDGGGSPVAGASYRWSTDRHSGWVYPPEGTTNAVGRFQGTWVAGWPGEGTLSVTVENGFSRVTEELTTRSTTHVNPPPAHATVWIRNWNNPSAGYSIDMTPLTDPARTYYAAIQWDGGYTGLQSGGIPFGRQLQFSVWDAPGHGDAEFVASASDVVCTPFGGEGTGINCEMHYPWDVGSAYRFEVTEEEMNGGSAITLHVTDLAAGHRRFIGTLRFARRADFTGFAMFVEYFAVSAPHCLAGEVRSAAIRRPRAWLDGAWVALDEMTEGHFDTRPDDPYNPGTPGCANHAARQHAAGLEVVIGGDTARDPNASRLFTIPLN